MLFACLLFKIFSFSFSGTSHFFYAVGYCRFPRSKCVQSTKKSYISKKHQKLIQNQSKLNSAYLFFSSKTEQLTRAKKQFIIPSSLWSPLLSITSPVETLQLFCSKHLCLILCIPRKTCVREFPIFWSGRNYTLWCTDVICIWCTDVVYASTSFLVRRCFLFRYRSLSIRAFFIEHFSSANLCRHLPYLPTRHVCRSSVDRPVILAVFVI